MEVQDQAGLIGSAGLARNIREVLDQVEHQDQVEGQDRQA
jgi:hypothetical protein